MSPGREELLADLELVQDLLTHGERTRAQIHLAFMRLKYADRPAIVVRPNAQVVRLVPRGTP